MRLFSVLFLESAVRRFQIFLGDVASEQAVSKGQFYSRGPANQEWPVFPQVSFISFRLDAIAPAPGSESSSFARNLYPAIMSRDPNPAVTVPTPPTLHPDNGVWRWSWTVFHSWRRGGTTLDDNGWWRCRRRLSIDDCFGAAAESEQG